MTAPIKEKRDSERNIVCWLDLKRINGGVAQLTKMANGDHFGDIFGKFMVGK